MSLRLTFITEGYPWRDSLAGVFHRDQARLMAESGVEVTVVAPTPWVPPGLERRSEKWRKCAELPAVQEENGVTVLRPRYLAVPRERKWFVPDLAQALAVRGLRLPRPDVVQGYFAYPCGTAARALARRWKVPYAVGMLGDDVNIYPYNSRRNLRVFRAVLRDAAFAFANGPRLAARAEQLAGVAVEPLSIGVSENRFAAMPEKGEVRRRLGLPRDKALAVYAGALTPTKGIGELIAALDALADDNFACVLLGDGPLRSELEKRANAICLGVRGAEDVALAMAGADLCVHPSHYEGLPTVLVEAAFAGLPVVTTDAPGCIDLAAEGRALAVPVGDAHALAEAIAAVLAGPEAAARRADDMRAHVRAHYCLETNTARLVAKYRELAAGTAQKPA